MASITVPCLLIGLIILAGCQNRPAQTDLRLGHIGAAVWPDCQLHPKAATLHCNCQDFALDLRSDGKTVIRCIK